MKEKKGVPISIVIILIITTLVISGLIFRNRDNIKDFLSKKTSKSETGVIEIQDNSLYLGKELEANGLLTDDGDLINYTHRLHTAKYGTLGLKSDKIDLYNYSGEVYIRGNVVKYINDLYVVNVNFISGKQNHIETQTEKLSGAFVQKFGIFLSTGFLQKYDYSIDNNHLIIQPKTQPTSSGETLSSGNLKIQIVKCNENSNNNQNCKKILDVYKEMMTSVINSKDGLKFYLNKEANLRFGSNGIFGYFIPYDTNKKDVEFIQENYFYGQDFVKQTLGNIKELCNSGELKLSHIDEKNIELNGDKYCVVVKGKDFNGQNLICRLEYLEPYSLKLKNIKAELAVSKNTGENLNEGDENNEIDDNKGNEIQNEDNEKVDETDKNNKEIEEDEDSQNKKFMNEVSKTTQIKIDLDNPYKFTSSRGYTILFPNKNIYFSATGINKLPEGLKRCQFKINVVDYKKGEDALSNPDVEIYMFCKIGDENVLKENPRIRILNVNDNNFVIYINNPAWYDFGKNLIIEV